MTSTADFIAGWEGYSGVAYWDVDHWRTGYGSDTEGPDEVEVVQGMTTTKSRALQNLALRIPQFQKTAAKAMGLDTWSSLSANQQTALTSLVYNYGRLPIKVYTSDPEKTAAGIAALQSANGGVNRKRRLGEAAFYLTGAPEKKPSHKPAAAGAGLTGAAAVALAIWTWYSKIGPTDQILVGLVVVEALLIFYLVNRLLHKQPDVVIHPIPPSEEMNEVSQFKQAKVNRDAAIAALASADKEVEATKQALTKVVQGLQSEITK